MVAGGRPPAFPGRAATTLPQGVDAPVHDIAGILQPDDVDDFPG
jgi:hypothetical protein